MSKEGRQKLLDKREANAQRGKWNAFTSRCGVGKSKHAQLCLAEQVFKQVLRRPK